MKKIILMAALLLQACGGLASLVPLAADIGQLQSQIIPRDWECHEDSAVKPARCYDQAQRDATRREVCADNPEREECQQFIETSNK